MSRKFATLIALLLLLSPGLACSLLRPKNPLTWHLLLEMESSAPHQAASIERTVNVINSRLDAFGVINAKVVAQGTPPNGRILVSLPDVPDRERLKRLITDWGLLELTAVVSPPSPAPAQTYRTKEEAIDSLGGKVPENRRVLPYYKRSAATSNQSYEARPEAQKWVMVEVPAIVDGGDIRSADAIPSQAGDDIYDINFSLLPAGANKFGTWTGAHINDYLGVVLNDEVKSIAYIKSQITESGVIAGTYTKQSAEDLALILRTGALPAPLKIVEEGPNK